MNTNSGNDPMLSSFISEDWGKFGATFSTTANSALSLCISQPSSSAFILPVEGLLSPDQHFSDLTAMWSGERRRVVSVKMEDDDDDSFSEYSVAVGVATKNIDSGDIESGDIDSGDIESGDIDSGDIDMDETDIGSNTIVVHIKSEIEDVESGDVAVVSFDDSFEYKYEINKVHMTEMEARRYVEEQFEKIAFVPKSNLSQREKIESILAKSDCSEFSVDDILNFDKKCPDSARACAKIVQNIPQRYRWECVQPEDIPSCYTIVADCKKVSNRDKPPRPMNAFMIWAQGARRLINELCPKMQNALISEALGYYWRQKCDAFKQIFEQEKIKLRGFHNVEFPEYKYKPKTKVQKAKEKQQLSLTKAKIRASVKLEKLRQTEEAASSKRTDTCSRAKKTKQDAVKKADTFSQMEFFDKSTRKSPTKPAIKDMLTIKILNDRLCRGKSMLCLTPQEIVVSSLGQMSPLDVHGGDTFDDTTEETGHIDQVVTVDKEVNSKIIPSSVFDTPANTPPVEDEDDDHHHSSLQTQHVLPVVVTTESSVHISTSNNQTSMSFPPVQISNIKDKTNQSLLDIIPKHSPRPLSNIKHHSTSTPNQLLDVTDWFFNYITESLSATEQNTRSIAPKHINFSSNVVDTNNNSSDVNNNNNCYSDANNNVLDLPTTSAFISTNSKLAPSSSEVIDLDTLLLDLNTPFLSDDDLRSIMNSL